MGNIAEKEDNFNADVDGEAIYETLARDISYLRCISEDASPVLSRSVSRSVSRSESGRGNRRVAPRRAPSRRKSIKRSVSTKRSMKDTKKNAFLLSELEVQVDGKRALLVPRKSVLKKKGFSRLKSRLTFISNRKSMKKHKMEKSIKAKSTEHLPTEIEPRKKPTNVCSINGAKLSLAASKSSHLGSSIAISSIKHESRLRPVSVHGNIDVNCNRHGNMALNMEKARLRKLASMDTVNES